MPIAFHDYVPSRGIEVTPNILSLNIYYLLYHVSFTFRFVDAFLIDLFQMVMIISPFEKLETGILDKNRKTFRFENVQSSKFFMRESLKVRVKRDKKGMSDGLVKLKDNKRSWKRIIFYEDGNS